MFRDKLLNYSFVASVLINVACFVWVGNSDLFQHADVLAELKTHEIKVYKPPVLVKPKPKPKVKPPPPPPKLKTPPPPVKQTVIKPPTVKPPPTLTPRPVTPHPVQTRTFTRPQPHTQPVQVAATPTGSHSNSGTIAAEPSSGETGTPSDTTQAPVTPPTPKPPPPPDPTPEPPPAPKPPPPPPTPPPPPPVVHHSDVATRNEPDPIGGFPEVNLPNDIDISSLDHTSITVSFTVDEKGRPGHIRLRPGTGNAEADNLIKDAISHMRFKPAVQDYEPHDANMEHTYSF